MVAKLEHEGYDICGGPWWGVAFFGGLGIFLGIGEFALKYVEDDLLKMQIVGVCNIACLVWAFALAAEFVRAMIRERRKEKQEREEKERADASFKQLKL